MEGAAGATTATPKSSARIAGKARAKRRAVRGARRQNTSAHAGAAVTTNKALTAAPAATSRPFVAGSDPERNVTDAMKPQATASSTHTVMVRGRSLLVTA